MSSRSGRPATRPAHVRLPARSPDAFRLRAIKPDLEVGITVGAGHFHQLEVPEQVNAMIERFLAVAA